MSCDFVLIDNLTQMCHAHHMLTCLLFINNKEIQHCHYYKTLKEASCDALSVSIHTLFMDSGTVIEYMDDCIS